MKQKNLRRPGKQSGQKALMPRESAFPGWLGGLFLILAIIFVYQPAWHAGFIWDDDLYVTNNPLLTAPDGLKRIWFSFDSPSQYFPLTYTIFRVEHTLWGFNAAGYHWVNILLHAVNALLVWRLFKRLNVPGAWLAAAIFAVHPLQVESVAWIAECKNVLMGSFFLLALICWIEFVEQPKPLWRWYGMALFFYVLALCSKTTACTLPAALLLILWLRHRPIDWQRLLQIIPFLMMGLGMGLVTVWWERFHQGTNGQLFSMGLMERVLIAGHAFWFYAGKLFWPIHLTFSYPKWRVEAFDPMAYAWLLALMGLGGMIYFSRKFTGRSIETAVLFFAATLSPTLGFIMLYTFRYTFVADHYQYVAGIGLIALAAAGLTLAFDKLTGMKRFFKLVCCGVLLLILGILTWRQCGMYANQETLWQATVEKNPDSFLAHNNLGYLLLQAGQIDAAVAHYQKSLAIEPDYEVAHYNLGNALVRQGRLDEAIAQFQIAVKLRPDVAEFHNNLGAALLQTGQPDAAIEHYQKSLAIEPGNVSARNNLAIAMRKKGLLAEAIAQYQKALQLQPHNVVIENNLAWLLATCPEAPLRNGGKAVELAEQANRSSAGQNPAILQTLAAAYAESGRFQDAIAAAEQARQLAAFENNQALASALQSQITLYQSGSPFRDGTSINAVSHP